MSTLIGAFGMLPFTTSVKMWLDCEGSRIPLAQAGSTFVVPKTSRDMPACEANLVVCVDGKEHSRRVTLVRGMSSNERQAMILSVDDVPF